uniref:PhoD-like phosphatase metallophosphatase domain-containing protein n=1 Tax=Chromera velia CCMP2878 TaxID=1169474 RepID=A0A0G4I320_9ALVE|eukprot:Cvel_10554.t1-p1 / transcript=Cvel_10554.t1 / gene=Cvel_10554 / organism=Chromera_velia_CCMP2878 / gene_product=hypothetical protein / transcript_product=hypothetical protein / location=Cvel_scaffold639:22710-27921(-) / protein_length=489 / sequence_SO=supercontig / SO=protein_coding / is_pseudo=false
MSEDPLTSDSGGPDPLLSAPDRTFFAGGDGTLKRLAFASCAKQKKFPSQPIWKAVKDTHPDAFFWIGDAHYEKCPTPECLRKGYSRQSSFEEYSDFVKSVPFVDGVYDDHDYGQNDGDSSFEFKKDSQSAFLDFIGVSSDEKKRRGREGLYSSHVFGEPPKQVKVILLDTRFHKEPHWVPQVGQFRFPGSPIMGAFLRTASALLGLGREWQGDILGEAQWSWLEGQLRGSGASVHVLVSSIQVLSDFPLVESWGHYPHALSRLMSLLNETSPRGLILLSGDVHFAEASGDPTEGIVELTSSGLTHTCAHHLIGRSLCSFLTELFPSNSNRARVKKETQEETETGSEDGATWLDSNRGSLFGGKNFGVLDFQWEEEGVQGGEGSSGSLPEVMVTGRVLDEEGEDRIRIPLRFPSGDNDLGGIDTMKRVTSTYNRLSPTIRHRSLLFQVGVFLTMLIAVAFEVFVLFKLCTLFLSTCSCRGRKRAPKDRTD